MADTVERTKSLYIATPAYGCLVTKEYVASIVALRIKCAQQGIPTCVKLLGNESLITRARNVLMGEFLQQKAFTHFLFIDADISFNADDIISMLHADKPVLCGIYAKKSLNWERPIRTDSIEPIRQQLLDFNINLLPNTTVEDNRYVQVLDAATGCMMIKREVLDLAVQRYPELQVNNDIPGSRDTLPTYCALFDTMIDPVSKRYLSEDYTALRRLQKIGIPAWVDLNVYLAHHGTYAFRPQRAIIKASASS